MIRRRARALSSRLAFVAACVAVCLAAPCVLGAKRHAVEGFKLELFVGDAAAAARFYEVLGFEVIAAQADGYTTLVNGTTTVALSPVRSWVPHPVLEFLRSPPIGIEIVLYTRHLYALHARLIAEGYAPGSIARRPWGLEDFRLHDPAGYYVRVTEVPAP